MSLFTFFLEYGGGTYISQVNAKSPTLAVRVWANTLGEMKIEKLGPKSKALLVERVKQDEPILLDGLKNTWCCIARGRGSLAIIHFTKTADD